MSRLEYLRNNEIREEIVQAVGISPGDRYQNPDTGGIPKESLIVVAGELQPEESEVDIEDVTLAELYQLVCRWAGTEYDGTAGCQWRLPRPQLKAIHRDVTSER